MGSMREYDTIHLGPKLSRGKQLARSSDAKQQCGKRLVYSGKLAYHYHLQVRSQMGISHETYRPIQEFEAPLIKADYELVRVEEKGFGR